MKKCMAIFILISSLGNITTLHASACAAPTIKNKEQGESLKKEVDVNQAFEQIKTLYKKHPLSPEERKKLDSHLANSVIYLASQLAQDNFSASNTDIMSEWAKKSSKHSKQVTLQFPQGIEEALAQKAMVTNQYLQKNAGTFMAGLESIRRHLHDFYFPVPCFQESALPIAASMSSVLIHTILLYEMIRKFIKDESAPATAAAPASKI